MSRSPRSTLADLEAENAVLRRRVAELEGRQQDSSSLVSQPVDELSAEELLSRILEAAPVVLWAIDSEGRFVVSRGRGLEVLGLQPDEVLGRSVFEVYARVPEILADIRRALAGETIDTPVVIDGLHFDSHYEPRRDAGGQIVGVLGVAAVVTERERARQAFRRSQSLFRTVTRMVPVGLFQANAAGRCVFVNPAWQAMSGLTEQQSLGDGWVEALHPEDRDHVLSLWAQAVAEKQPFELELRLKRPDGSVIWVLVKAEPEFDEAGTLISYFGAVTDFTSRYHTEQALRRRALDLESCIEQAPDFILLLDRDLRIEFINHVNPAYSRGEVVGASVERFLPGFDQVRGLFESVFETGRPVTHEFRTRRLDGSEGTFVGRIGPVRSDDHGDVVSLVVIASDVSAQKAQEEELRQRQAELAHVSRLTTIGEMTSLVAHELKTPLQVMQSLAGGCLRRLNGSGIKQAELVDAIETICGQIQRTKETIESIRRFVARKPVQQLEISPKTLIETAGALVSTEAKHHNVQVHVTCDDSLPHVVGDEIQLQQVLVNLLLNGMEAMEQTAVESRQLHVAANLDGEARVVISVSDAGCGLPEGFEERIFERFHSTKPRGLGIGLAISRSIVESHGGRLWATRNDHVGTTFRIRLPLSRGVREHE